MKRLLGCIVVAGFLVGCQDFAGAYGRCVDGGACEPEGGSGGGSGGGAGTGGSVGTGGSTATGGGTGGDTGGGAGGGTGGTAMGGGAGGGTGGTATGGGTGGDTGGGAGGGTGGAATGGGTGGGSPAVIVIEPASIDLFDVASGDTVDTAITVRNTGGSTSAYLIAKVDKLALHSTTDGFNSAQTCSGPSLDAGATCTDSISFVASTLMDAGALFTVSASGVGLLASAPLGARTVPVLSVSPSSATGPVALGQVNVGQVSAPRTFTVTNASRTSRTLTVSTALPFQVTSNTCATIAANKGTCTFAVTYEPSSVVTGQAGTVSITPVNASEALVVAVTGTGLPAAALSIAPAAHDYGNVDAGDRATFGFTLSNTVGAQVTSPITLSLPLDAGYALDAGTCAQGQTLAGGASCTFGVTFAPKVYGVQAVDVTATATTGGQAVANLTGKGIDHPNLGVTVTAPGTGTLTAPGYSCSTNCTWNPAHDSTLTVTATPSPHYQLQGWTGVCTSSRDAGTCQLTVFGATNLGATFVGRPYTVNVGTNYPGEGDVSGTNLPSCQGNCTTTGIPYGQPVTYTATAGKAAEFVGWSGCPVDAGTGPCSFSMAPDASITALYAPYNYAFLSPSIGTELTLNGVPGADQACRHYAADAGLRGTFVAYLSGSTVTATQHVGSARGWIRTDHRPFVDTTSDLLSGRVVYPLVLGPAGTNLARAMGTTERVATGQLSDGGIGGTCGDWRSAFTPGGYAGGIPTSVGPGAVDGRPGDCTSVAVGVHVYCLGKDYTSPLPARPIPPGGRRAFTSRALFQGMGDVAGTCANEAADAGLPGTWDVLRGTRDTSACSAFSLIGGTWYRPDGAQLFAAPGDLCQSAAPLTWLTAPGRLADGTPVSSAGTPTTLVWTGNQFPGGTPSGSNFSTCNNWEANVPDYMSAVGDAMDSQTFFYRSALLETCDNNFAVYCFQK